MTTVPTPAERPHRASATRAILVLALIGVLTGLVRYRLLDVPLERDEGGFAVMARLILDGVPPYAGAYDYKPPGLYLAYAAFIALFGGGPAGIHFGLLLTSLGSMVFVHALVKRWSGETGALVAAFLSQAFLASTTLLGFAAHATHFVVFWSLAGFLLLERGLETAPGPRHRWLLLAAGAAFGAATLMKQPGAVFFLAALAVPFLRRDPADRGFRPPLASSCLLVGGFILPLAAVAGWLALAGALDEFVYWNITYPSLVAAGSGATGIVPRLYRNGVQAAGGFLPAWIAGAAAFAWLMRRGSRLRSKGTVALFFVASALSVAVGYETRTHYFVLLVPALAVATGVAVSSLIGGMKPGVPRVLAVAAPLLFAGWGIVSQGADFLSTPPVALSRRIYNPNQFADAEPVAAYIRRVTSDSDRVAVLGSEPEILFLSGRRTASKYIFTNFFNERHGLKESMEREMIAEIEEAAPAVIVMVNQPFSWGAMPSGDWTILRWAKEYLSGHYELTGTITPVSATASRALWDEEARRAPDPLAAPLIIFRRIPGGGAPPQPR
jgi:hypothetical protein